MLVIKNLKKYKTLLVILVLTLLGCNAVKRVVNDPKKFKQVADIVVARGYCINDTIISTVLKDTTIYRDHKVSDSLDVDKPVVCNLDTVTSKGFRVVLKDGNLIVDFNGKMPERTIIKKEIHNIRDKRFEVILKEQLASKDDSLSRSIDNNNKTNQLLQEKSQALTTANFRFYGFLVIVILFVLGKSYLSLRKYLPILP